MQSSSIRSDGAIPINSTVSSKRSAALQPHEAREKNQIEYSQDIQSHQQMSVEYFFHAAANVIFEFTEVDQKLESPDKDSITEEVNQKPASSSMDAVPNMAHQTSKPTSTNSGKSARKGLFAKSTTGTKEPNGKKARNEALLALQHEFHNDHLEPVAEDLAKCVNLVLKAKMQPLKDRGPLYKETFDLFMSGSGYTPEKLKEIEKSYQKAGALYPTRSATQTLFGSLLSPVILQDVGYAAAAIIPALYYAVVSPILTAAGTTPPIASIVNYFRTEVNMPVLADGIEDEKQYTDVIESLKSINSGIATKLKALEGITEMVEKLGQNLTYADVIESLKSINSGIAIEQNDLNDINRMVEQLGQNPTEPQKAELQTRLQTVLETALTKFITDESDQKKSSEQQQKRRNINALGLRQLIPSVRQTPARMAKVVSTALAATLVSATSPVPPVAIGILIFFSMQLIHMGAAAYDEKPKMDHIHRMNMKYGYDTFLTQEGKNKAENYLTSGGPEPTEKDEELIKLCDIDLEGIKKLSRGPGRQRVITVTDIGKFRAAGLENGLEKLKAKMEMADAWYKNKGIKPPTPDTQPFIRTGELSDSRRVRRMDSVYLKRLQKMGQTLSAQQAIVEDLKTLNEATDWRKLSEGGLIEKSLLSTKKRLFWDTIRRYRTPDDVIPEIAQQIGHGLHLGVLNYVVASEMPYIAKAVTEGNLTPEVKAGVGVASALAGASGAAAYAPTSITRNGALQITKARKKKEEKAEKEKAAQSSNTIEALALRPKGKQKAEETYSDAAGTSATTQAPTEITTAAETQPTPSQPQDGKLAYYGKMLVDMIGASAISAPKIAIGHRVAKKHANSNKQLVKELAAAKEKAKNLKQEIAALAQPAVPPDAVPPDASTAS